MQTVPIGPSDVPTSRAPAARTAPRGRAIGVGLVLVVTAVLVVLALVALFLHTERGQILETRVMEAMYTNPRTDAVLLRGLAIVSVGAVALAMVGVLALGAMGRRLDLGIAAAGLIAAANVTTQVLKYGLIDRADFGWSEHNTLPSGHVTVILSILLALVVVCSPRWRPLLVPLIAFFGTCAGVGTIIVNWHRPSDVVAAYAVVVGWTGVVVATLAGLRRVGRRVPGVAARAIGYAGWAALAVSAVGVLIVMAGVAPVYGRRALLVAALALAAVGLACSVAVAAASYAVGLLGEGEPARAPLG